MTAPRQLTSSPQYLLLNDITWQGYEQMQRELAERNIRLTYDQGWL